MLGSGCVCVGTSGSNVVPLPVYPTDEEDALMAQYVPEYYKKILEQQEDIEEALK
jgi:hypothetical protein